MYARTLVAAAMVLLLACSDAPETMGPSPSAPPLLPLIVGPEVWFTQVSTGDQFSCALRNDGAIECWGDSDFGQAPALKTAASGTFVQVASRGNHSCAVRSDGAIECWGVEGSDETPALWTAASGSFVQVAPGPGATCAVRADGAMECRGEAPGLRVRVPIGAGYVQATVGQYECALKSDRTADCWFGTNRDRLAIAFPGYTQLVDLSWFRCWLTGGVVQCDPGSDDPPAGLIERATTTGFFTAFDVHFGHACGLRNDGAVECWGDNGSGQAPPLATAATGGFSQVAAAAGHTCALRTDGAVQCWGVNEAGQAPAVRVATRERVLPTATFTAPAAVIVTASIELVFSNAQVPGYPSATSFTFAFDCGSGFAAPTTAATTSCPTSTAGTRTVRGKVIDQDGDTQSYTATVSVQSAQQGTTDLRGAITTAPLSPDIRKALLSKLDAALRAIAKGNTATACTALADFMNQVRAQSGKAIETATADAWLLTANQLRTALGC